MEREKRQSRPRISNFRSSSAHHREEPADFVRSSLSLLEFGTMPVSPVMPPDDPFVVDVATAELPFISVPISLMTPPDDPFVADEATAALPFGAVAIRRRTI